jgi:hypothetical protein
MTLAAEQIAATGRRRAPRYAIEAPVRFWTCGGEVCEGLTVNVGRFGMLVRTAGPVPAVAAALELRMVLTTDRQWSGAYVACTGHVLRTVRAPAGGGLFALTIDDFALWPGGTDEDPRAAAG